jgi:hypothetical protein
MTFAGHGYPFAHQVRRTTVVVELGDRFVGFGIAVFGLPVVIIPMTVLAAYPLPGSVISIASRRG